MEETVDGKVCQILLLAEQINVTAISEMSAETYDALTSASAVLDVKLLNAAVERAKRREGAVITTQESFEQLHDGQANAVGEGLGITNQPLI